MKKLFYVFYLIVFVLMYSCAKQDLKSNFSSSLQQSNKEVSAWLNTQKNTYRNSELWIDSIVRALDFQHQEEVIIDTNVTLLIIPLDLNIKKEIGRSIQINTTQTKLLVIKGKEGNILSGKIIGITSNQIYTENYIAGLVKSMLNYESSYKTEFNGTVSLLKLNKSLVYQSIYFKGKYLQRKLLQKADNLNRFGISPNKKVNLSNSKLNSGEPKTDSETCTDWYWLVYNYETGEIISITYQYTECTGSGGGGGGGGANLQDVPDWGSIVAAVPSPYLCPTNNNFRFKTVGNSYTGQIEHLGMSLVGPGGQFLNIEFGSTCLSIPFYNISPSDASDLFIQAYNAAVDDVLIGLNNGSILPRPTIVKNNFKNYIVSRLQELKPGSSMSTDTGCGGSVPITNANFC